MSPVEQDSFNRDPFLVETPNGELSEIEDHEQPKCRLPRLADESTTEKRID
jgi:hypothetical protein